MGAGQWQGAVSIQLESLSVMNEAGLGTKG